MALGSVLGLISVFRIMMSVRISVRFGIRLNSRSVLGSVLGSVLRCNVSFRVNNCIRVNFQVIGFDNSVLR